MSQLIANSTMAQLRLRDKITDQRENEKFSSESEIAQETGTRNGKNRCFIPVRPRGPSTSLRELGEIKSRARSIADYFQ